MKTSSNMNITAYAAAAVLVVVLLLGEANVSVNGAVVCNPSALSPCSGALTSKAPPPPPCCVAIKQQKPCFCQYLKDPNVRKVVGSPAAKRVANACGVAIPNC